MEQTSDKLQLFARQISVYRQKSVDHVDAKVERLWAQLELVVDFHKPIEKDASHSWRGEKVKIGVF